MDSTRKYDFSERERAAFMEALDDPEKRRKIIEILVEGGALRPEEGAAMLGC